MSIYALNLFNLKDPEEYLTYTKKAEAAVAKHGGKPVLFGQLSSTPVGDIKPRQVMMIVEWESKQGIHDYIHDPELEHVHVHRDNGVDDFVWHLFERLEDLGPVLRGSRV